MPRVLLLSLIIYLLVLVSLVTRNGDVLALSLVFVVYLSIGLLRSPNNLKLDFERSLSSMRVAPDMPVEVSLNVTNLGATLEEAWIDDDLPKNLSIQDGSSSHHLLIHSGQSTSWSYTVKGKRGNYKLDKVKIKACDPFGLVNRTETFKTAGNFFVIPPILRLKNVIIRPRHTRVYSGIVPARTGGTGIDFLGVREYREGDPTRWINWRTSARYPAKMFSNEFEQERVADVGIVLDGRIRTNLFGGENSLFEYSVLAAATMADVFLSQGNRVSLLVYGRSLQWTFPGYGKTQRERILRRLAQAQPGSSQVFDDLDHIPTRLFPAHSQVVLVSPLTTDDLEILMKLRARGYHIIIVSPDPVSFEVSLLTKQPETELAERIARLQRELMLRRLRRAGIQVINWDISKPFDQIAQSHLGRRPLWLSTVETNL